MFTSNSCTPQNQNSHDGDGEKEEKYEGDNNDKKITVTTTLHYRLWKFCLLNVTRSVKIAIWSTVTHCGPLHFNNEQDALIIQIYYVIKFYMFRASSLPIIRSSTLTLLGSGHQKNLHETYQRRVYSRKLLMIGREDAQNM